MCDRELETEQNCSILTPTLLAITAFLSCSPGLLNRGPGGPDSLGHVLIPASSLQLVGVTNCTHSTHPRSKLYSAIPRPDAPVIYTGVFPILTARPGRRSIYSTTLGLSGPGSDGNEGVLRISLISMIGPSQWYSWMSDPWHLLGWGFTPLQGYIIIIIMSRCQQRSPTPSLAISPYRPSLLEGLPGSILYRHRAVVCMFELVVLTLLVHVKGSTELHNLWVLSYFSCMSGSCNFRNGWRVAVQILFCWVLPPGLVHYCLQHSCVIATKLFPHTFS